MPRPMRWGFTLIEVLVVISIIGVLVAILLPAVSYVREGARRTQCQNNLRNIGVALGTYHESHKLYPPAKINPGAYCPGGDCPEMGNPAANSTGNNADWPVLGGGTKNTTGWVLLLPFLEQDAVYDLYDHNYPSSASAFNSQPKGMDLAPLTPAGLSVQDKINQNCITAVRVRIAVFTCPSDSEPDFSTFEPTNMSAKYSASNARRSNYRFATGEYDEYSNTYGFYVNQRVRKAQAAAKAANKAVDQLPRDQLFPPMGMFGNNGAANNDRITDGVHKTIAVGESLQVLSEPNSGTFWGGGTFACCHGVVYPPGHPAADFYKINAPDTTSPVNPRIPRPFVFSSMHPGGANFLFADGTVDFRDNSIDPNIFYKLNTIDGSTWRDREMIDDY